MIVLAAEVSRVVPKGGGSPKAANRVLQGLHDLAVAPRMEVSHVVSIHQIDGAFLADLYQQVGIGCARLIGKKHGAAGAKVGVVRIQSLLVPRSEIVAQTNGAAGARPG